MMKMLPESKAVSVEVFAADGAIVGGRQAQTMWCSSEEAICCQEQVAKGRPGCLGG
jgi:hypothetical protein